MRNALVYGNVASDEGGGIYLSGANTKDATIFFTTIMDNTSGKAGAGLYVTDRGSIPNNAGLRYRGNLFLDNMVGTNARDLHSESTPMRSDGNNSFTNVNSTSGHASQQGDTEANRTDVAPEPYGQYGGTLIGREKETMSSVKITSDSAVAYKVPIDECKNETGANLSSDMTGMQRIYGVPDFCTIGSFEARY